MFFQPLGELVGVLLLAAHSAVHVFGVAQHDPAYLTLFDQLRERVQIVANPHPMEGVEALIAREYTTAQIFVYDANHGFNSDRRKDYHEVSAELARERTLGLFAACGR